MAVLVMDSSVTLELAFDDEFGDYSRRVFNAIRHQGALVPALWELEVANILSNGVTRGRLRSVDAEHFLQLLSTLPIEISTAVHTSDGKAVLFKLAQEFSLTAYDACYLHLAMTSGLPLASKDKKLNAAAGEAGVVLFA